MLSVIGIGPGSQAMMTMEAVEALQAAEIIVGYKTYTHLVKAFTGDKQVIKTGMCKEIERCQAAIELAQAGHNVALIAFNGFIESIIRRRVNHDAITRF